MTRLVHRDGRPAPAPIPLTLTIFENENGGYAWAYSDNLLLVPGGVASIRIVLKNATENGARARVNDFASTGMTQRNSPIKSFSPEHDGRAAILELGLLPNQLIDFGVFVEVTRTGHDTVILFCDPQASNDPIKTP